MESFARPSIEGKQLREAYIHPEAAVILTHAIFKYGELD